jgi:hypothetical protein
MGRTEEAVTAYLAIPDGRNEYYGMRATQRLLALSNNNSVRMQLNSLLSQARSGHRNRPEWLHSLRCG